MPILLFSSKYTELAMDVHSGIILWRYRQQYLSEVKFDPVVFLDKKVRINSQRTDHGQRYC